MPNNNPTDKPGTPVVLRFEPRGRIRRVQPLFHWIRSLKNG